MKDVMTTADGTRQRAALYIRVSTDEQGEKYGAEFQRADMLKYAEYHGYDVRPEHIYEEIGKSGASDIEEREKLPLLFAAAARKEFDVVLVWKVDRFFRKVLFLLQAIER